MINLLPILFLLLLSSCKTREQVAQEKAQKKLVSNLNTAFKDQSKLSANITSRMQALEESVAKLNGQMEEQGHKTETLFNDKMEEFSRQIRLLEESKELITERLIKQERYLKTVLDTLKGIGRDKKKKPKISPYRRAMINFNKKYYRSAKQQLLELFENKKIKGNKKARIVHHLGVIEYSRKDNKKAIFYFSHLYTKYPRSDFNKSGLLHLAKTFKRIGKKAEAQSTLKELIAKFPKSKEAKQAKVML